MKKKKTLLHRVIAVFLSLALIIGLVPSSFAIAFASNVTTMGTLSAITSGGTVTNGNSTEAVVSYDTVSLNWDPADPTIGRNKDGWWIGVKMTAPVDMTTEEQFANVVYQRKTDGVWSENKDFWNAQDSDKTNPDTERYLTMWGFVNEEYLNEAIINKNFIIYEWQFDWNADDTFEQKAVLKIDPAKVLLKKNGNQIYPSEIGNGTVSVLSDGLAVTSLASANIVKVEYTSDVLLTWAEENPAIGRNEDGWWAGIKITAPTTLTKKEQFTDVVYQKKEGTAWSANKSFWDAQDSDKTNVDTERYLTMWELLNDTLLNEFASKGTSMTYSWRFDWNGDGVFEQTVILDIAPTKVTLEDADGTQIYPELGVVTPIHTGDVTGVTGNVVVTSEELTLNRSEMNGKYGWWTGIKVTAPTGLSEEDLQKVKFQKKEDGATDWGTVTEFWTEKSSTAGDSSQFIKMWQKLTPALLRSVTEAGRNIVNQYRFDWDADGTYDQYITFIIVPSDKIVLKKVEQTGFKFETETPADAYVGQTFTNIASGNQNTGNVIYEIIEGSAYAAFTGNKGELQFNGPGTVTVKATSPADDVYDEETATYSITVHRNTLEGYKFETTPDATTEKITITYEEEKIYTNKVVYAIEGSTEDKSNEFEYVITEGDEEVAVIDSKTGTLSIKKAGTVVVTATRGADEMYNAFSLSYTLEIKKAEQPEISFVNPPSEITYSPKENAVVLEAQGGKGNGTFSYEVTEGKDIVASIRTENGKGIITTLKAGEFKVKLSKAGDDCYNDAEPVEITIKVHKAEQTTFKFEKSTSEITYNENGNVFENCAINGESASDSIKYEIISGDECVSIDDETKPYKLTILKAGKVSVQATKEGDACYNSATAEYTLNIKEADQSFTFQNGDVVSLIYGTETYQNEVLMLEKPESADGFGYSQTGKIVYEIEGSNEIGASINAETGEITFSDSDAKVGTITVKATKEGDDCYEQYVDDYELTVTYLEDPKVPYTLFGETLNESGWYTGGVTITAADGYLISYDNKLSTSDWAESVVYDVEGNTSTTVSLKNAEGYITDKIEINSIKIDKQNPASLEISYSKPLKEVVKDIFDIFGIYNAKMTVTIKATDGNVGSGIASLIYNKGDGDVTINIDPTNNKDVEYSFKIEPQYRNKITLTAVDVAGRMTVLNGEKTIVVDKKKPEIEVGYEYSSGAHNEHEDALYTQKDTTVHFAIEETNFDLSDVPVATINENKITLDWKYDDADGKWKSSHKISGNGDYVIKVTFTDIANNEMTEYEKTLHIDNILPVISTVVFDPEKPVVDPEKPDLGDTNTNNFKVEERTATITINEHNFYAKNVNVVITAKDVSATVKDTKDATDIVRVSEIQEEIEAIVKNPDSWVSDGYEHTVILPPFVDDAHYTMEITYEDLAGNEAEPYHVEPFVIDDTEPTAPIIEYSEEKPTFWESVLGKITFGYYAYNPDLIVTITAEDLTSGVDYFEWTYTREDNVSTTYNVDLEKGCIETKSTGEVKLNEISYSEDGKTAIAQFSLKVDENLKRELLSGDEKQYRGYISCTVTDRAGNSNSTTDDKRINIIDSIAPGRTVEFSDAAKMYDAVTLLPVESYKEGDKVILYYEKEATATLTIEEENFYKEDVEIIVTKNGEAHSVEVNWEDVNTDVHVGTFTLSGDGDYEVTVQYRDRSHNTMDVYNSPKIAIDDTDPIISVEYDPEKPVILPEKPDLGDKNEKYYNVDRTPIISITEHNFRADDVVVKVTAKDVSGVANIAKAAEIQENIQKALTTRSNWTRVGDVHTTSAFTFTDDAHYTLDITYADIIENEAKPYTAEPFVVDKTDPTDPVITYSKELNFWSKVLSTITLGYYSYNPDVIVKITAEDVTSGVDYFEWSYTREDGASTTLNVENEEGLIEKNSEVGNRLNEISYSADGKTATTSFKLTADEAKQYRGYISCVVTDRAGNDSSMEDNKRVNIVDKIPPKRVVTYPPANQVVDATTFETVTEYNYAGENTNKILYYNNAVTTTVTITEANFYQEDVTIKVNDVVQEVTNWTQNGDVWTGSFVIANEGDYIVTMDYTDRSNNVMETYKSQLIIVDKTLPVVNVEYSNQNVKNTIQDADGNSRDYFDAVQTATITIKDHSFRPDDVVLNVIAKNVVGQDVAVRDYAAQGISRTEWAKLTPYESGSWTRSDDTYKLVVQYPVDANYTFDIEYTDLASNVMADYATDYFTVDTTAPTNLEASYSTSVLDRVLETVTFGYYNAMMTVTIQAEDETSGIYHFMYSYLKSANVSQVNAELIDQAIQNAEITHNGKVATAKFTIPELVLKNNNQFNGTIEFTAYDRAENSTEEADNVRVVVDNITPTSTVTYNEPVQMANDISYYAGNIEATVVINEANFYAEDVVVSVTKDGNQIPVSVNWTNNSVDVHTGTFTLSGDGAYYVAISYKDRSSNEMTAYVSNELTIDTVVPTISLNPIKMNSANKDEVFGFTLTAEDSTYLDIATLAPVLKAVVRGVDGSYMIKTISLGNMQSVVTGKSYAYVVENLTEDAVYSLTCTVRDMAGNEYSQILLADGNQYGDVKFSVNREGSTFTVDKNSEKLLDQYYVYEVSNDVIIEEVNVDPVERYVVRLNGNILEEGSDYTTTLSNNADEWSKRTYIIDKSLFEAEGEYSIVVESTDKAETVAYSDVKAMKVAFVVDKTKPVLTISGLEEGGRYQVEEQTVTVIPTDDGGRLKHFKVIVLDSKGNPLKDANGKDISVRFDMSGEKLMQYLADNDGKVTFTVPQGLEIQIQIICNDYAVNVEDNTNEYNEVFKLVTVSQSGWILFYANKPLFYGSIAGLLAVLAGVTYIIILYKKRKKEEK